MIKERYLVKVNPFSPNSPISHGMFVGRLDEIGRVDSYILQTQAGQPHAYEGGEVEA
jgi:hypothetical protein